jgi:hypothetical protein
MDETELRNEFVSACHRWIEATEEREFPVSDLIRQAQTFLEQLASKCDDQT